MGNESQNLPGTFWRTGSGNYLAQIRQQTTAEKDAEVTREQWTQHSDAVKFLRAEWRASSLLTVFPILIAGERSTPSDHMAVLLHLIQSCRHGDPHRTFKVNPIAARRCLGVRVCSSVCDCEPSEQRAGDEVCVYARGGGGEGEARTGSRIRARTEAAGREGGERGGGRWRKRRRRRRRKWLSVAGGIKSSQTRPENCIQEGSDRRRMEKGEQHTGLETSRKTTRGAAAPCLCPRRCGGRLEGTLDRRALAPPGDCEPASRKVLLKSGSSL
ncbi:uncharacterized protein LOC130887213 [Chionomys nivalis]|uniref:uncharacterized protein LOC130887213 n=1 Tax=Chionomys nivalis TaxID=269649 RepID=UPI002597BB93|nr:uncharacterized protein LOC130887213 [Chionomys nivalis]